MTEAYLLNSIVIQVNTPDEFYALQQYFNYPSKLDDRYPPGLPMYVRSNLSRTDVIGRQSNVFAAGSEYVGYYRNGISTADFLGIQSLTDIYKSIVEYW